MKISEDVINDIRNNANIVDVIGRYIPLVKKGKGYTALCPFHDDHDPSLSISEDKQIYKCFVCGNGGNVFTFVSNFKKISFPESVVEVSKIIGKPIEVSFTPKKLSKYQPYYDVLTSMITYCNYLLVGSKQGGDAMKYLDSRGINKDCIDYFNIGFNPSNNVIYKYLNSQKFSDENIIKAGACRMLDNGMADIFYNRIIFPIHDVSSNPIAFTARDFENKSDSKYINSSENIIYTKGDHLYNLNRAKNSIKKDSYVILCEGVMDVIAFYKAKKENVVASLGTALTIAQIDLLKSVTNKVVLFYDGDKAGQNANLKNGTLLLRAGFDVMVADNNTEFDPDEIVNKFGINALKDLESKQITFLDFVIKYYKNHYNLDNYNDRKRMTIEVSNYIDLLSDQYDRDNYTNELYEITKIRRIDAPKNDKKEYNNRAAKPIFSIDGLTKAEYIILVQIAMSNKALDIYQNKLGCLLEKSNQDLAMLILEDYRKNGKCSLSRIYDETSDDNIKSTITNLISVDDLPAEFNEEILESSIEKVKIEIKNNKLKMLLKKAKDLEVIDPIKSQEYYNESTKLIKELGGNYGKN